MLYRTFNSSYTDAVSPDDASLKVTSTKATPRARLIYVTYDGLKRPALSPQKKTKPKIFVLIFLHIFYFPFIY